MIGQSRHTPVQGYLWSITCDDAVDEDIDDDAVGS